MLIEHNLDLIKNADWIIDLGPGAGDRGGQLIARGTPEQLAQHPDSHTGRYLKPLLEAGGRAPLPVEPAPVPATDRVDDTPVKPKKKVAKKATRQRAKEPVGHRE